MFILKIIAIVVLLYVFLPTDIKIDKTETKSSGYIKFRIGEIKWGRTLKWFDSEVYYA